MPGGDGMTVVFDTPAGTVRARASGESRRGSSRCRCCHRAVVRAPRRASTVKAAARQLRADVAFGGGFYAIVDCEAAGLSVDASRAPELRRAGMEIAAAVDAAQRMAHPATGSAEDIAGDDLHGAAAIRERRPAIRDGPARRPGWPIAGRDGDRRADGRARCDGPARRRSAVRSRRDRRHALLRPRRGPDAASASWAAIVAEIEGSAWITGEHTFLSAHGAIRSQRGQRRVRRRPSA